MRVYLDGVLDGSGTNGSAPASGTSSVKIGRASYGDYFNGLIDEARVSNAAIYSGNFTPQTSLSAGGNTAGLWKFDSNKNWGQACDSCDFGFDKTGCVAGDG